MEQLGGTVMAVALMVFILAVIVAIPVTICAFLFTSLRRVPERHRQLEPALVWLLLIPCFSLIWNFFVYPRVSRSLSSVYRAGGRTDVGDCGYGIGLAYAICMAVGVIPYLGLLGILAAFVLVIVYLVKVSSLSRGIPAPLEEGEPLPEPAGPTKMSAPLVAAIVGAGILVFVAMVGIIAAIAIPNLLNGIDRGKQKRTMADLRTIAVSIEAYEIDAKALPVATDLETLESKLVPSYLKTLPKMDGWGRPLTVDVSEDGYSLISTGKDGTPDGCEPGATRTFDADICFADGEFVRYPEGQQR